MQYLQHFGNLDFSNAFHQPGISHGAYLIQLDLPRFAVITFVTLQVYIAFTLFVTEWRMVVRRSMNDLDTKASSRAIDSLLNYETVKYFGNEI